MRRFWKGRKRLAKKAFKHFFGRSRKNRNYLWHWFWSHGLPRVGDVTHDCSGQNHRITKVEILWRGYGKVQVPEVDAHHQDEGPYDTLVCPCGGMAYQPPESAEYIRQYLLAWLSPDGREVAQEWKFDHTTQQAQKLLEGKATITAEGLYEESLP